MVRVLTDAAEECSAVEELAAFLVARVDLVPYGVGNAAAIEAAAVNFGERLGICAGDSQDESAS